MATLGGSDPVLTSALERLHEQFEKAPVLGSLVEIGARDLLDADLRERGTLAFAKLREVEPERLEGAIGAQGLLDAADLLGRRYTLLATNVPFLGRGKQNPALAGYISRHMPDAKADLATAMLERICKMAANNGVIASVSPQSWLFAGSYKAMREEFLTSYSLSMIIGLGSRAFETITGEVVNTALVVLRRAQPQTDTSFCGLDANDRGDPLGKAEALRSTEMLVLRQADQKRNPDARIAIKSGGREALLSEFAASYKGLATGDMSQFIQRFWEPTTLGRRWEALQEPPTEAHEFSSCSAAILWDHGVGALHNFVAARLGPSGVGAWIRGGPAWSKKGVAVAQMSNLPSSIYSGSLFDESTGVVIPHVAENIEAIWCFINSPQYAKEVRKIDRSLKVPTLTLLKVPFELETWKKIASERYPAGLPKPYSDDPTQWIFHGNPAYAQDGAQLHVALARLAGYRWPAETNPEIAVSDLARERIALLARMPSADMDGLLPLHAIGLDRALADRLRVLLAAAYGTPLTPAQEADLVRAADIKLDKKEARDLSIETWLRDRAFRQHCVLFQHRPFLWQIWDGLRDGFSAFLYYHRLNHAALEKLTFSLLGDWIAKARDEGRTAHEGQGLQLQQKLRTILDGEAPYDIFVRWKPLSEQPFGWRPDLDDGVRLNIRPFMTAEVLREQPRLNWNKDRGTDLPSAPWFQLGPAYGGKEGDRINDHHLTLAEKRAAQSEAKAL